MGSRRGDHRGAAGAGGAAQGRPVDPYRNHPVFVAQHATATCCRSCLETWHGIAKGHRLDRRERAYVVEVIGRWIDRELATSIEGRDSASFTSHRS